MKRSIFFAAIAATLILGGCNGDKIKQLEQQNKNLAEQNMNKDSILNDLLGTITQFETNLDIIREREELIELTSNDPEMRKDSKEQINSDLLRINELLDQNRTMIEDLQAKVDNGSVKNRQLRNSIAGLNKRLEEKNAEIMTLTERLASLDLEIQNLTAENSTLTILRDTLVYRTQQQTAELSAQSEQIDEQTARIAEQTATINTAFYVAGSKKELKEKSVIDGKNLNKEVTRSAFTAIDITEVAMIPLDAKKVKLVTPHPEGAYELVSEDKRVTGINIKNPEAFWRNSKYLVVMVN
ncbi:MAG: hypothetical protein AAF206_31565 [Bacteroidota bacterium]